jgi:hypothetical protein
MRYVSFTAQGRSSFRLTRPDGAFDLGAGIGHLRNPIAAGFASGA